MSDHAAGAAVVDIANCPDRGLHGERDECFVCSKPVDHSPDEQEAHRV